jgi:carboxyl-terminal processing protease
MNSGSPQKSFWKFLKEKKALQITIACFVIFLFSGFFTGKNDLYFEINKNMDLFSKVYKEITFNYVDNVNPEEFMKAGIQGMLNSLDPYTIYIGQDKKDEIDLITNGKYGGVGISIGVRANKVTVIEVLDGYSAQRQGIRVGDHILQAAGKKITPENVEEISSLVKGDPGTTVDLKVTRNDDQDTINFNLVREEVIVKSLTYAGFYPENSSNVYLKLSNFSRSAADEVRNALKELREKKEIKSIVLDLRGNPGGLLDVAVNICEKFLKKGDLIVSTKGRDDSSQKKYFSNEEPMVGNAKLVVLINDGSASASEIVAGALQDHDRGVILGTKSFGKGLVQTITPLSYNASLKITTAKYYTPSGRCIQKIDYAKENKVFAEDDSIPATPFLTDNKRTVYSAGGITPDTTLDYDIEGDITKELLAKGMFFKFADHYYYSHQNENLKSINDGKLFSLFKDYIKEQKFEYTSDAQKEVDKLIQIASTENMDKKISSQLNQLESEFQNAADLDINKYKQEILRETKEEIATRYSGTEGKIKVGLDYDKQFQAALNILNNAALYDKLLNKPYKAK